MRHVEIAGKSPKSLSTTSILKDLEGTRLMVENNGKNDRFTKTIRRTWAKSVIARTCLLLRDLTHMGEK